MINGNGIGGTDPAELGEDEITIVDLEGEKFEIIDTVIVDEHLYAALLPYSGEDDPADNTEFTILEITDDPDDEENCILRTVDDDELYEKIGDAFLERFEMPDDEEDE